MNDASGGAGTPPRTVIDLGCGTGPLLERAAERWPDFRPPLLLRPVMRRFHARRSRQKLFEDGGFTVVHQLRPLRLGGHVLITVERKA